MCATGVCNAKKCQAPIKDDYHNCSANTDCEHPLICSKLNHKCMYPKQEGESCNIHDADGPCTDDCACYGGKCTKYGSLKVGTKIIGDYPLLCEYLYLDSENKCASRSNLPKLTYGKIGKFATS